MGKGKKVTGRCASIQAALAMGTGCAMIWTVLGAALVAKLVDSETIQPEAIGYGSMGILLTASALGALAAYGKVKKNRAPVCFGVGGIYYLCLLAMTALFFGGQYTGMGVTAVMILLGCCAAMLPGLKGRGGASRKNYKIRTR